MPVQADSARLPVSLCLVWRFAIPGTVILILLASAWFRLAGSDFRRPLEGDEVNTLTSCTCVGVTPTDEHANIYRMDDFYKLQPPGIRRLAIGTWFSLGRWIEPNNHVLNSFLMNYSLAAGGCNETAARFPALLGALTFACLMYCLCSRFLSWHSAAPFVAIWAFWCPYVVCFSQTARGYSWALALQALLLMCLLNAARRPSLIFWGFASAAVSVVTFMNTISLAVDWLLPVYATCFFMPVFRLFADTHSEPIPQDLWRKNLVIQMLGIGAVGLMFLMAHLPFVFTGARQYGIPIENWHTFIRSMGAVVDLFLAGFGWKVLGVLGLAGLAFGLKQGRSSFVSMLFVTVTVISLAHFLAGGKIPYARACGYLLPLVLLGAATLIELALRRFKSHLARVGVCCAAGLATGLLVVPHLNDRIGNPDIDKVFAVAGNLRSPPDTKTLPIRSERVDCSVMQRLPAEWLNGNEHLSPGEKIQICLVLRAKKLAGKWTEANGERKVLLMSDSWQPDSWPSRNQDIIVEQYRFVSIAGQIEPLGAGSSPKSHAIIFWYLPLRIALANSNRVFDHLKEHGVRYQVGSRRYHAKLQLYTMHTVVILACESKDEWERSTTAVLEGIALFGGDGVVFVPTEYE